MPFNDLKEMPAWITTILTLVVGAGGAKLLAVYLENRRLEKKEYRDTLLGRIRELEVMIGQMNTTVRELSVELALVKDENSELREKLGMPPVARRADANTAPPM